MVLKVTGSNPVIRHLIYKTNLKALKGYLSIKILNWAFNNEIFRGARINAEIRKFPNNPENRFSVT